MDVGVGPGEGGRENRDWLGDGGQFAGFAGRRGGGGCCYC